MGLPMRDVHSPTVTSGPTSNGVSQDGVKEGASLTELIAQKDSIEAELSALGSVLDSVSVQICCSMVQETNKSLCFSMAST